MGLVCVIFQLEGLPQLSRAHVLLLPRCLFVVLQILWCYNKPPCLLLFLAAPRHPKYAAVPFSLLSQARQKPVPWTAHCKVRMLAVHSALFFPFKEKPGDRVFFLIVVPCAGWMGTVAGKCSKRFCSLQCGSAWLCTHLGCCSLLAGLCTSHKGNLAHKLGSLWGNEGLGLLILPSL